MAAPPPGSIEGFAAWLARRGYAPATVRRILQTVKRWRRSGLPAVTWLARLQEGSRTGPQHLPTETARVARGPIRRWYEYVGTPVPALPLPTVLRRARPQPPRVLTAEEEGRIRAALRSPGSREPQAAVVRLLLAAGLRVGEALGLLLEDVKALPAGVALHVRRTKTWRERTVPLPQEAAAELQAYLQGWRAEQPASPWLFPSPQQPGKPLSTATVRLYCRGELSAAAGVAGIHPHAFRHRVATRLLEAGVDVKTAGALLGHASVDTTRRYQHPGDAAMRRAIERAGQPPARRPPPRRPA